MSTRLSEVEQLLAELAGEKAGGDSPSGAALATVATVGTLIKGQPVRVFEGQASNGLSAPDRAVDCRGYNAVHVLAIPSGTTPTATLTLEGGEERGDATGGTLPAAAATQSLAGTVLRFDCPVGAAWVRPRLASISGTGAAYTVIVTPFVMAGPAAVALLAGSAAIGAVDTELPAAAALADAAANPTVPTVGAALLGYNGTTLDRLRSDTTNGLDVDVTRVQAATSGGCTPFKRVSTADTNAAVIKASAGQVYLIAVSSVNAAVRYLKLYNKASAPTVGTDVPVLTIAIPGNTTGAGNNIHIPTQGIEFTTGIAMALTTEATDAGSTGVATSEIVVNVGYK